MEDVKQAKQGVPAFAWVIFAVVYLASMCAPINQFKVPPLADVLTLQFSLDPASFGILMSVFSIMGIILAFPAGYISRKLGLKVSMVISVAVIVAGSLIGTFADSFAMLSAGRFIEGIGVGLISVAAPAAITAWFPQSHRGIALGLWTSWYPLGTVIMLNIAPTMAKAASWQSVWWFGTILGVVALILLLVLFRMPKPGEVAHVEVDAPELVGKSSWRALANKDIWLLGITFFMFNFVIVGVINSFYPNYLNEAHGMDMVVASSLVSALTICSVFMSPIGGKIVDKLGTLKKPIIIGYILLAVLMTFIFKLSDPVIIVLVFVLYGIITCFPSPATRIAAPELVKTVENAGMGMAMLSFWQNLGGMLGSIVFGFALMSMSWDMAALVTLLPAYALAAIISFFIKIR